MNIFLLIQGLFFIEIDKDYYLISSGTFGKTPLIAHSKYDEAFNKVSMAFLLLSIGAKKNRAYLDVGNPSLASPW